MKRFVIASIMIATAGLAHADKNASLDHYAKGRKAYAAATFEAAIAEFQLAYAAYPAPEYLHDIAQAFRRLDRACDALSHFERYLAAKPDASNKAEVTDTVASLRGKCAPPAASPAPAPAAATAAATPAPAPAATALPHPVTTRVAAVEPASSTSLSTSAAPATPSPYTAVASAGVALLDAGPVVMPLIGQIEVGVRRRLGGPYDVHVGAGLALSRLPYDDVRSGAVWLTSPQITVDAAYELRPRLSIAGGAALGATWITGLGTGNPFVEDGMESDSIVTARARAEVGVAWRMNDKLAVRVMPLGYQWSPARKLAKDISALHGFAMSAGVAVGW